HQSGKPLGFICIAPAMLPKIFDFPLRLTIGTDIDTAEVLEEMERESFSSLRKLAWQNGHYFTLRTTFNQPGHLATVVAFDLPIN
ncbi:hypothetical protein MJM25_29845, partial [Salmonella enterica subsp. enterica serovar Lubbock]|nr:hypothetical protein [Salmonella enterica subsp. enterica serovar Lubbock]